MTPWIQITGWTLVHFIWQGTVIASAAAVALRVCRRRAATLRYAIASTALLVMALTPVVTALRLASPQFTPSLVPAPGERLQTLNPSSLVEEQSLEAVFATAQSRLGIVEEALPIVVALWLVGVAILLARAWLHWSHIRGLHKSVLLLQVSSWQATADRLGRCLGLRRTVRVVELALVDVPTVIGWLRPVVLLPLAAVSQLPVPQVEAVIAHELAHVRRHDYMVNLLQTAVEAVLFYHPSVWWLSSRIRDERELCCDDLAIDVCGDRVIYATALAEFESRRLTMPARTKAPLLVGVHATGGQLLRRVQRLLDAPARSGPATPGWLVAAAGGLLIAAMAAAAVASAQSVERPLQFEVASIKPNGSGQMRVSARTLPGGEYQGFNITLRSLIQQAYGLPEYLVVGGPDWLGRDRYDVHLKSPAEPDASQPEAFRSRLRSLFAERLKLTTHYERRDIAVYHMVLTRSDRALGPEIMPSNVDCDALARSVGEPRQGDTSSNARVEPPRCAIMSGGGRMLGSAQTMSDIARALQVPSGRVVQDRTGLLGRFDFTLTFTRDPNIAASPLGGGLPGNVERARPLDPDALSVFTALQEQLGLKLESARGPIEHLVIDSVQKPEGN